MDKFWTFLIIRENETKQNKTLTEGIDRKRNKGIN